MNARTLLFSSLAAVSVAGASPAQKIEPAVEPLLKKVDARLGMPAGKDRCLILRGDYTIHFGGAANGQPVMKGKFAEQYRGATHARHRSEMGDYGALERGTSPDKAWESDPAMGAKVLQGVQAAAVRRYYANMAGRSPRELYRDIESVGKKKVGGVDCTWLRMECGAGKPDHWSVAADGRVMRITTYLPSPESAPAGAKMDDLERAQIHFADWRKVGELELPFRRTMSMGPAIVTYQCKTIEVVEAIGDETFVPPKSVQKARTNAAEPAFGADGKPNYQLVQRQQQHVASIRVKCKPAELSKQLAILLPEVMAHVQAVGAKMAGAPFSRYHKMGEAEIELEAGIPVKAPFEEKGRVKNGKLPAGKVASCWHVGPYQGLGKAHQGLGAWVAKQKLTPRGGPWEVYWTDPGMVPDPKKWRTQLFAPVK